MCIVLLFFSSLGFSEGNEEEDKDWVTCTKANVITGKGEHLMRVEKCFQLRFSKVDIIEYNKTTDWVTFVMLGASETYSLICDTEYVVSGKKCNVTLPF